MTAQEWLLVWAIFATMMAVIGWTWAVATDRQWGRTIEAWAASSKEWAGIVKTASGSASS